MLPHSSPSSACKHLPVSLMTSGEMAKRLKKEDSSERDQEKMWTFQP